MVTDAVWTDLNGDGRDDLVVVGEWMAPRVFRKNEKDLEEITGKLDPEQLSGWWNAVHTADLNEDGRPDMVLGNHGLNSQFRASWECPVRMWVENFDGNGIIEQILSTPIPKGNYPIAGPYDASYGVVLGVDEGGQLYSYPPAESGFRVDGAIRAIGSVTTAGGDIRLVIARNNNSPTIYKLKQ